MAWAGSDRDGRQQSVTAALFLTHERLQGARKLVVRAPRRLAHGLEQIRGVGQSQRTGPDQLDIGHLQLFSGGERRPGRCGTELGTVGGILLRGLRRLLGAVRLGQRIGCLLYTSPSPRD